MASEVNNPEEPIQRQKVKLVRHDLNAYGIKDKSIERGIEVEITGETTRDSFVKENFLPSDCILKVKMNGNYIPWSLISLCCSDEVEIQVLRPHQSVKAHANKYVEGQETFREAVSSIEKRVTSLEESSTPANLKAKEEAELEGICKQVEFLQRRLEEADKGEWIRDEDGPRTDVDSSAAAVAPKATQESPPSLSSP